MSEPPSEPPARYGPFHRVESDTQTPADAAAQEVSSEVWGRIARSGSWPAVKAFDGPLAAGQRGIEFYTDAQPDPMGHPQKPRWSGDGLNEAVRTEDGFAKISVVIVRNTQRDA